METKLDGATRRHLRWIKIKGTPKCLEDARKRVKRYRERHPERVKEQRAKWYSKFGKEYMRNYMANKRKHNPQYAIRNTIQSRISKALRSGVKDSPKTAEAVGCSLNKLKYWLQSKLLSGMTWQDFLSGRAEIDHVVPCSSFDLTNPDQLRHCYHYRNLRLLWPFDNRSKGRKVMV